MDPYKIIKHPLSTEKSIRLMDSENKLIFVINNNSNKKDVKDAVEMIFKVKVIKVNTHTLPNGQKRAYVKLSSATPAIDIATEIGMI